MLNEQACWVGVFPGCIIKQIINAAQLVAAAQELADFRPAISSAPNTSGSGSGSSKKRS